jgi:hypothetical protein
MREFFNNKTLQKLIDLSPYILLFVIFIFIWVLNILTPLWADDYCRLASSTSFFQAAARAFDRYFSLNGRFFVHFFNYIFLGNYPALIKYFNFLNSLLFVGLIAIIFLIGLGRKPRGLRDNLSILFIFSLLFIGSHGIGEVILWKSGSIGYLWGVTFELAFLLPVLSFIRAKPYSTQNKLVVYGYYALALIAATFIEHLSFAASAFILLLLVSCRLGKKAVPDYIKVSGLLHIVGSLTLLFSKGNLLKSSYQMIPPLNERILNGFSLLEPVITGGLGWIFLICLALALTNRFFVGSIKNSIIWPIFFLASMTVLIYLLLPTEQLLIFRTAFPFEVLFIVGIVYLSSFVPNIVYFDITVFSILLINCLGHGVTAYKTSVLIKGEVAKREKVIAGLIKSGEEEAILGRIPIPYAGDYGSEYVSKYVYVSDITQDKDHWKNTCFAKSYGLKGVRVFSGVE